MLKLFVFLAVIAFSSAQGQSRTRCYNGTVAYSTDLQSVYENLDLSIVECPLDHQCAKLSFLNTVESGTAYVESSFCFPSNLQLNCSVLVGQPGVGMISECTPSTCNDDECNGFSTNVCNNGTLTYDTNRTVVIARENAGYVACPQGLVCGLFRFNNLADNYLSYVESAFCIAPNLTLNCSLIAADSRVGELSNCFFESGAGNNAPTFSQQVPNNRGYRCERGTFAYDINSGAVVFAENVTDAPCELNEICGFIRFQSSSDQGHRTNVESAFCINPIYVPQVTCNGLDQLQDVNNVTDCTIGYCSGDFCDEFSHRRAGPECPDRPPVGDIQILPGCTMTEILDRVFYCQEEAAAGIPFPDQDTCSAVVDRSIGCMSGVVQDCIQFQDDGETLCPSFLDTIPHVDITPILRMVRRYAMNVTSIESLRMVLEVVSNGTADLSGLDLICASPDQLQMGLNLLRNLTSNLTIGLGTPVCRDDRILDDLIEWGLEQLEETINANEHRDFCLSFDKFKARVDDAIRNRCFGLDQIEDLLNPVIGQYLSSVVQRAIDITKYYLLRLEVPGCQDVPYPTHYVCNQDTVAYLLEERTVPVLDISNVSVCPPNYTCGMWRWINTDPAGDRSYVEFGFCAAPNFNYTCPLLLEDPRVSSIENCTVETCNDDHRCLRYSKEGCPDTPEDDVPVLPRCSLRQSLERGFGCLGSFVGQFPFADQDQCRSEIDNAVRCARNATLFCLYGECETVLDFIPGLRRIYRDVRYAAYGINSLADGLRLLGLDDNAIDMAYRGACGDRDIREMIMQALESVQIPEDGLIFDNPVCDDRILFDLANWGLDAARAIVNAESHQEFCVAMTTLRNQIINAWNTRCSSEDLITFLRSIAPPQIRDYIETAVQVAINFITELEIPNCDQTGLLDCSRFQQESGTCALRRAWLCEYVNWKLEFLTVWLRQFIDYTTRNFIVFPINPIGCIGTPEDLCMDRSQRVCREGADGCRFCFCRDLRYRNPSRILDIYRSDQNIWRLAFGAYRRAIEQSGETCSYS